MIKESFKKEGNNYIVLPEIKNFFRDNDFGQINNRQEGINVIENFAQKSDNNKEVVNIWLDKVIKEGIKHIYLSKISFFKDDALYKSELFWKEFSKKFNLEEFKHVNETTCTNELEYRNMQIIRDTNKIIRVSWFMSLYVVNTMAPYDDGVTETYPIFVDLDINKKIFIIRIKSKTNLYKIKDGNTFKDRVDLKNKIQVERMAKIVLDKLSKDIGFNRIDFNEFETQVYCSYYKILDSITKTPEEIKNKILECNQISNSFIDNFFRQTGISQRIYEKLVQKDLQMFLEKFISISYPNKTIFTRNSFAYPIKLIATDAEDTKIEETASGYEALQTKGAFYDHKKIISSEKSCDGMYLAANREYTLYYGKTPFVVKCDYTRGFARIRFEEYVVEGDIKNVLSRVISNL